MHQALALPAQGRCRPLLDPLWGNPYPALVLTGVSPAGRRGGGHESAAGDLFCRAAERRADEGYAQSVPHFFPVHPGWLGPCIALLFLILWPRKGSICYRLPRASNTRSAPSSPGDALREALAAFDGAIVRSGVKITAEALAGNKKLKAIVRAGVGTDNIDKTAATRLGIVVMNTPAGNTLSTAEHTIAMMLALSRISPPPIRA